MKSIIILTSLICLLTLCTNAQTKKDSLSSKTDTTSKTPNTAIPEYQNYPFNPANTEPNVSPGVTVPSIKTPGTTLPSNSPGNIKSPGTQIAPDTSKIPAPANPALPATPGIQDNKTPMPE